jgi:hypothetical protein
MRWAYRGLWASLCLGCFGVGFSGGRSVLMREDPLWSMVREETGPVGCWISGEDGARLLRLTVKTG